LTTLFENATISTVAAHNVPAIDAPAAPRKKQGWLPLLTVLFLISYGLMTMLIVEQGATIESQRALIRELLRDSTELSAMRKAQQDKPVVDAQQNIPTAAVRTQAPATRTPTSQTPSTQVPSAQAPTTQTPSTQAPLTQIPSTQAPATPTPSSQAAQQHRTRTQTEKQKPQFQMPSKPALDLVDDPRNLNVT
jgi:hypothetical protein